MDFNQTLLFCYLQLTGMQLLNQVPLSNLLCYRVSVNGKHVMTHIFFLRHIILIIYLAVTIFYLNLIVKSLEINVARMRPDCFYQFPVAVVVVIVWQLDLQLPLQLVPITIEVVSLNRLGELQSIQHYVIKFVRDLLQVNGFLPVLLFHPPIKLTVTIQLKYC